MYMNSRAASSRAWSMIKANIPRRTHLASTATFSECHPPKTYRGGLRETGDSLQLFVNILQMSEKHENIAFFFFLASQLL